MGDSMLVSREKKQELHEMNRKESLRFIRETLATYRVQRASGRITVDVRSGKAIWVKPVEADEKVPEVLPDEAMMLRGVDEALRELQGRGVSGTVTLVVCQGRGVDVEKVAELSKIKSGVRGPALKGVRSVARW